MRLDFEKMAIPRQFLGWMPPRRQCQSGGIRRHFFQPSGHAALK
jgi:hypothetical protein